ncbi:MAG: HD domain-containing protein [Verrucomicrobia bacterium]|nr:HD domain-containing protein [Verrucomicrobiota bacterium]NBS79224.1 HD domain-containing protein [bacterium]NBS49978.1 HD domain-containing protein [Verrucomicrobiota bacterium]NBT24199.1 HD domain-containing protein [bacterium]NBV96666.1 HD domain-containing protein [Verrucomicrobiota bacterium]
MIPDSPLIREASTFMAQREKEPRHVRHVTLWSVFLFRKLESLHQLQSAELELLVAGSLLHDVGWSTATEERPHHKESARIIREHPWRKLSKSKREFVALLARYHRKSIPSPTHRRYQNLPKDQKKILHLLAGILRVADAIDRSHQQSLHPSDLMIQPATCLILAEGKDNGDAEFGIGRKGDLFHKTFGRLPLLRAIS